jgi:AcrR family transcriptional regulator
MADEAGITPQAAYRYFGDIHALILLAVRRVEAAEHEQLIAFMTASAFATEADLAKAVVAFITQAYQGMAKLPAPMRDRIARDYHDISYDVLWQVSEAIHAVMLERGNPCTAANVVQLVAGLTAVAAVAKSLFLRDIVLLRQPAVQQMMAGGLGDGPP